MRMNRTPFSSEATRSRSSTGVCVFQASMASRISCSQTAYRGRSASGHSSIGWIV